MMNPTLDAWIRWAAGSGGAVMVMVLLGATALAAQEDPPAPPERDRCVCAYEFGGDGPRAMFRFNRARIGVRLGETRQVDGRVGVDVADVTEGGPADRAGLQSGDILVSLNGATLGDEPADRVVELLSDVDPGDTVTVTYRRSGRDQTARIVTERGGVFRYSGNGDWGVGPRVEVRGMGDALRSAREIVPSLRHLRLLGGDIDLVDMNPGLGEYFGVDEGVLVSEVAEGSGLGLRAGDVILSIGDREVRDAGHARSIIGSYRPDEEIRFEVMRQGGRVDITGTRGGR